MHMASRDSVSPPIRNVNIVPPTHSRNAGQRYGTTVTGQRPALTSRIAIEPANR
jgi:hypothetical protein